MLCLQYDTQLNISLPSDPRKAVEWLGQNQELVRDQIGETKLRLNSNNTEVWLVGSHPRLGCGRELTLDGVTIP